MPDSLLHIIIDANIGAASAPLGTLAGDLRGVGVAAGEADAGLVSVGAGAGTSAEGLGAYNVETGMALTGTEGLTAAMAAFDAEAAATVVAEAELAASAATAAESEWTLSGALDAVKGASLPLIGELGVLAIAGMALKGAYDQTVGSAVTLDEETRTLGLSIGASATDAGKLIFASESLGVSFDTLNRALDQAINKMRSNHSDGIQPNIDGLGKLSDAYLALAPGVERTQFLLDNFGRSGAQMAPLLELGSQGIKALGDQADATGNVLSERATEKVHAFDLWVKQLGEDAKGTAVQLGLLAIGADDQTIAIGLAAEAEKRGLITENDWNIIRANAESGVRSYAQSIQDLQGKLDTYNQFTTQVVSGMGTETAARLDEIAAIKDLSASYGELAPIQSDADYRLMQYGEDSRSAEAADKAAALAIGDKARALQASNAASALQAGLAGTLTQADKTYQGVLVSNADKITKLKDEIAKYTAEQGQNITVVEKGQYSAEQYSVAQERVTIAEERLATGHYKTQAALDSATLSVRTAQDAVDKMTGHLGSATTTTADYSTKIGKDQAALDLLTGAEKDAADQLDKTTGQFILQQVVADTKLTPALELRLAHTLGLIDDKSYNAALAIQAQTDSLHHAADGTVIADSAYAAFLKTMGSYHDSLDGATKGTDALGSHTGLMAEGMTAAGPPVDGLGGHVAALADPLSTAAGLLHDVKGGEDALYDKKVTITVTTIRRDILETIKDNNYVPPHKAAGGPVSAGIPYWVGEQGPEIFQPDQSGTIIPHGQAGRGAQGGATHNTFNIYDSKTAALVQERIRHDRLAGMERMLA